MDIQTIGAWVFLGVGAVLLLLGAIMALRGQTKPVFITYFTGFVLAGIGVFGINFMNQQSSWINALLDVVLAETAETAEAAFDRLLELVGSGEATDRERAAFATLVPMYLTSDVVPVGFSVNDALLAVERETVDQGTPADAQATLQFVTDNVRLELAQRAQLELALAADEIPPAAATTTDIGRLIEAQSIMRFRPSEYDATQLDPVRDADFQLHELSPQVLDQLRFGVGP